VFADVLGVPQSSYRDLHRWAAELTTVPTTSEGAAVHQQAVAAVAALFAEMLPYKQANPADDLLTDMALATGDDRTYSARDFVGMATSMLIAGNDTTANLLASAIYPAREVSRSAGAARRRSIAHGQRRRGDNAL
jgi:cytochrome P450